MNNLDKDIKRLKNLIQNCDFCNFAACEQCEINWNDMQSISNVVSWLENYREDYNHRCQLAIDRAKEIEKLKEINKNLGDFEDENCYKINNNFSNNSVENCEIIYKNIEEDFNKLNALLDNKLMLV